MDSGAVDATEDCRPCNIRDNNVGCMELRRSRRLRLLLSKLAREGNREIRPAAEAIVLYVQITEYVASCSIAGRSGKKPYTVSVAGGCWKDEEEERDRRDAVRHSDRGKRGATFVQQLLYKGGSTRTGRDVAWRDKW